jgi:hypothetical protein
MPPALMEMLLQIYLTYCYKMINMRDMELHLRLVFGLSHCVDGRRVYVLGLRDGIFIYMMNLHAEERRRDKTYPLFGCRWVSP